MHTSNHTRCQPTSGHCFSKMALWTFLAVCALSATSVAGFAPSFSSTPGDTILRATSSSSDGANECDNAIHGDNKDPEHASSSWTTTRRQALSGTAASLFLAASTLASLAPQPALADGATAKQEILSKLAGIPTFTLVNGPKAGKDLDGIPFQIWDPNSATGTGFFFMDYDDCVQALEKASETDSFRGAGNIWSTARVQVVPLSIALQLSLSRRQRVSVNEEEGVAGIKLDTVGNLIPSADGSDNAITLDTQRGANAKRWDTKGRVPLFAMPDPTSQKTYYSFETNPLIAGYRIRHQADDPSMAFMPTIEVRELTDVFRKALGANNLESLQDFAETIQPTAEARAAAIKLLTEASKTQAAAYNLDKVYLVVSAKNK